MKYYLIAGEASGDLHASNLMKELKKQDPEADFRCWGGDLMEAQGGDLVKHYRDLAFMGFIEVIANLRTIMKNLKFCRQDILEYMPDAIILVDYPGFNLRIAEFAHNQGFKVIYYISPQVWAWKKSRVYKIRQYVDRMFVILPFEKEFYHKYDFEVDFVGHPLLDAIEDHIPSEPDQDFIRENYLSGKPIIAILPGSRKQEISRILPVMLSVTDQFPDYEFVIAGAPSMDSDYYRQFMNGKDIEVISGRTHDILRNAFAALVTSGTATLETALFGVPEVVCYKGSALSYSIAVRLVDVKFISLVNLIMDNEIVKELIQKDLNRDKLITELQKILDPDYRKDLGAKYIELKEKLGGAGASYNAANGIISFLNK
jgi:lipid-A-disaccharide synthase